MLPLLLFLFSLFHLSLSQPPRSFYINCGSSSPIQYNNHLWLPDSDFISVGIPKNVSYPWVSPTLSTVRSFTQDNNLNNKFCYQIGPLIRSANYMLRTTYFYGGVNGLPHNKPPVFDQMVDATLWGSVNTTDDYARNLSSYYEGVFKAKGKSLSFCVGVNNYTDSDPFISTIELVMLGNSVYNSTDFDKFGLSLIARHSFGYIGPTIRLPDDPFDRFWQPFGDSNPISGVPNVSVSGIWNLPPAKIFDTRLTVNSSRALEFQWPQGHLPSSNYYIALYFASDPESDAGRVFDISINNVTFYRNLNVTSSGVAIFATQWPLFGPTNVKLVPVGGLGVPPLINGGEVFNVLLLGKTTLTRDVIALQSIKRSFKNPPSDWNGDPCFPAQYSWTGITCSNGTRVRIVSINLMDMDLSGSLSPAIANLTALNTIILRNNSLSGPIPSNLDALKYLEILHIQNNNMNGSIPQSLLQKPGLNFTYTPGNDFRLPSETTK